MAQSVKWLQWLFLALFLWISVGGLTGCKSFGNAEGYEHINSSPDTRGKPQAEPLGPRLPFGNYDWNDPQYRCVPIGSTESIPSYRNRIEHTPEGRFILRGDRCQPLSIELQTHRVEVSTALALIGYQGGIYQYQEGSSFVAEAWCYSFPNRAPIELLIEVRNQTEGRVRVFAGARKTVRLDSISRDQRFLNYEGANFAFSIDLSQQHRRYLYRGEGTLRWNGSTRDIELVCRVNLPR